MIISGALLSGTSLLIFTHLLDQRSSNDLRRQNDRIAGRLCTALQDVERFFATPSAQGSASAEAKGPAMPPPGLQSVNEAELVSPPVPAVMATGSTSLKGRLLVCPRRFSRLDLVVAGEPGQGNALLLSTGPDRRRAPEWIRLTGSNLIQRDQDGDRQIRLAPWTDLEAKGMAKGAPAGSLYRVGFGGVAVGLTLAPALPTKADRVRNLALVLGLLGIGLTMVIAWRSSHNRRKDQPATGSFRRDGQTSFLTHYALVKDLEPSALRKHAERGGDGFLVTIDFRYLERQRGYLSEVEINQILTKACRAIEKGWAVHPGFNFYHVSKNKIALIVRSSGNIPIDDNGACEALLARLLGIVSGSIQISSDSVLAWDDVIITGQRFPLIDPPGSLLTMQAFGEILAAEDRRSYRLVKSGDDLLVKDKGEIRSQLTSLKASDLELRFQPILQLSNPGHFGLELLIRFLPPALSKLGTGHVIQLAHDIGITHKIDALVVSRLADVQQQIHASEFLRHRIEYVSVNVSSDSVSTDQRLNQLISLFKQHSIDSSIFCIEITEMAATDILAGSEGVTTASERLMRELNFRIFIDDFGSGLSNYRRISEAWYDAIKLDIDLIKGIDRSFRLQRYVGSFIETVHALGKTVVCEGVETHNELTAVIRLGADALQGFLVSPPLSLEDVESFIRSSEWADRDSLQHRLEQIRAMSRLRDSGHGEGYQTSDRKIPLERYIIDNWSRLRSFEEFVLLFVNELKSWGLEIYRFSLAFLPDQDDIDCSQYVWVSSRPGLVSTLRMERDFLEQDEHLRSPLHFIATRSKVFRQQLIATKENGFPFLDSLKDGGCSDYLGIRLDSRGVSIPVLTIALHEGSIFSDQEVQRIEAMSSLLSLLFYAFESERSKRLAMLDPLTQLANRRSFDSFLKGNVSASRAAQVNLSLALIDIDQFKVVNDVLGHAYGDRCLKEIADALRTSLSRKSDFVGRLGGEEFAIILPKTDAAASLRLCEKLRESIQDKGIYHPGVVTGNVLTVSIGIASWDPLSTTECDADRMLQLADDCLYEAKRHGRNRVVCRSLPSQIGLSA
ncbi:diguanylate cyclase (GGDEF) domain-containing protein [Cyanobium gracile PCC 6307]|uniref:Diguanylate cyclase (GGDEF) domain-containing protein n=2 Tax=Cyanobium gracile TaxID=59930 RepID=K9PAF5_CYAGP|nr:diguanylate cyclase (GGDEF) domain-containing protein [Cyanobium gracile PCC 6307]